MGRGSVQAEISAVEERPQAPPVHLLVPVADRDRMLWLAEKACELAVTSWRPVLWRRSASVVPRGEGPTFAGRVRARMAAALEQSSGAHLPQLFPEASPDRAIAATPAGTRIVLQPGGTPLAAMPVPAPATLAIGPEGGLDEDELSQLEAAGFVRASLGDGILRFETAALSALAVVRALLHAQTGSS
jgi:16S rRNA (uracil1498-N3)-methyltransferase